MSTINIRHGKLVVDFRYLNIRCRETTNLANTSENRKKLKEVLARMDAELLLGTFDYGKYFPKSTKAQRFAELSNRIHVIRDGKSSFQEFAETWYAEKEVEWRPSQQQKIRQILNQHLLPVFGNQAIHLITKSDLLAFRSSLTKVRYGKAGKSLSASRINQIMVPLRMILNEAADRYHFETPYRNIKVLKLKRKEIHPFSLEEVWRFLDAVRPDYRDYYLVRFFTGMRTGEIDGLKRKYVDLERRVILIREAKVLGQMGETKTQASIRDITMNPLVHDALERRMQATEGMSEFVFCTRNGRPLDYHTVNRHVWQPTLKKLGFPHRRAYETRHTAASLWLAAGENPEWVARQLGHANTLMLFKVYSRYIPNLTHQDGSAFEQLLNTSQIGAHKANNHE